jgi:hypothetical protein
MKRSSGIKRLGYEALRRLDNLRYRAWRLSLFHGVATRHEGSSEKWHGVQPLGCRFLQSSLGWNLTA